jgi:hypothetical protein
MLSIRRGHYAAATLTLLMPRFRFIAAAFSFSFHAATLFHFHALLAALMMACFSRQLIYWLYITLLLFARTLASYADFHYDEANIGQLAAG